jgi:hypothetical protein
MQTTNSTAGNRAEFNHALATNALWHAVHLSRLITGYRPPVKVEHVNTHRMEWTLGTLQSTGPDYVDDLFRAPEHDVQGRRNWTRAVAISMVGKGRSQGIPYNDTLLDVATEVAQEAASYVLQGFAPTMARWMATRRRLVVGFERTQVGRRYSESDLAKMDAPHRKSAIARMARQDRNGTQKTGGYIRRMPLDDQLCSRFNLAAILHGREVQDALATAMEQPHDSKRGRILRKRFIRTVFGERARNTKERYSAREMMRRVKQLLHSKDRTNVLADIDRRYEGVFGSKPSIRNTPDTHTAGMVDDKHTPQGYDAVGFPCRAHQVDGGVNMDGFISTYSPKAIPLDVFSAETGEAVPTGFVGRKPIAHLIPASLPRRKARATYPVEPETAEVRFAQAEAAAFELTGITGWDY